MERLNDFLSTCPRSGIRRIMDKAIKMDPAGKEIIHLEVGQPQEVVSHFFRDSVNRAIREGYTQYTQNAGLLELRRSLSSKLQETNGYRVTEDEIFVTPGATYAVSIAVGTLINAGDEVLVPDPGYPNFSAAVKHYGGTPVFYTLQEKDQFEIDVDRLCSLVTSKTKLIIVNSPSNPTGGVLSKTTLQKLVEFAESKDIWILSDEVYEAYSYTKPHCSPMVFGSKNDSKKMVSIYSFSKTYNMTGLRVGYLASRNEAFCKAFLKAQELYISCAPSISQIVAIDILKTGESLIKMLRDGFSAKLKLSLECLGDNIHYRPEGAFYLMINIEKSGLSSNDFADRLLDQEKIAVAPGATFGPGSDKFIRIALTESPEKLKKGLQAIKKTL